jgi:hypothetical protein
MAGVYITAFVPAESRDAAESAVEPYLASPNDPGVYTFSAPLVPASGPSDAEPTHYGVCAKIEDSGGLYAAMPALVALIPGSAYQVVAPWKSFRNAVHWVGWLNSQGLQPRVA